jgi:signal transduction histidine kinase
VSNEDRFGKKGTGIGLSTVKKLVEGLGGKIHVDSRIGEGTTFEFTIAK